MKVFAVFCLLALLSAPAFAAVGYVVTKTADSNDGVCDSDCSLREAIAAANANPGPHVILGSGQTYGLSLGQLTVTGAITIDGNGSTINGNNSSRVLQIQGSVAVTINDLTITGGNATGLLSLGGGLNITGGGAAVVLNNCTIAGNSTAVEDGSRDDGGGIAVVGSFDTGVATLASLTLNNSTVSGNSGSNGGGIACVLCSLTVTGSTIVVNSASDTDGGGIDMVGDASTLTVTGSALSGNDAGVGANGGALSVPFGASTSTLTHNRIVSNTATTGSAIFTNVGTVTAVNNWWGCNFGAGATGTGCTGTTNGVSGSVSASPYLILKTSASPSTIAPGGSSTATADLRFNSANTNTSSGGGGTLADGTNVAFSATRGTFAPPTSLLSGKATDLFTSDGTSGPASLSASIDGQTISASVTVGTGPFALTVSNVGFGSIAVGAPSAAKTATVSNPTGSTVTISAITVGGANAGNFAVTGGTCTIGTALTTGTSCTVALTFTPDVAGARAATLSIASDAPVTPSSGTLSGTGTIALTVTPSSLNFGSVPVGTGANKLVTFLNANTTGHSITLGTLSLSGANTADFAVPTVCNGVTLAAGDSCGVTIVFTAGDIGTRSATLTIPSNATNGPSTVALTGSGVVSLKASPTSLSFGSVLVGTVSATKSVTVTNLSATVSVTLGTIGIPSGYETGGTCSNGLVLGGGASCSIDVQFAPTAVGATPGTLTIPSDAGSSPNTVALTGTGIVTIKASLTTLSFNNVLVGTVSPTKSVVLTNQSPTASTTLGTIGVPSGYQTGGSCSNGLVLSGGASCSIDVQFAPTAAGPAPGTLTIPSDAGSSPNTVALSGTGIVTLKASFTSLNFGNVIVGTVSPIKTVTLTNQSPTASATFGTIGIPSGFQTGGSCSNGLVLAGGASCSIDVQFAPTATGAASGTLTIPSDASGSPNTVALSGTGIVTLKASVTTLNFGNQPISVSSPIKTVTLTNLSPTVSITLGTLTLTTGYTRAGTCDTGTVIGPSGSCSIDVRFAPGSTGATPGTLSIPSDATNTPISVTLSGTGTEALTISPGGMTFGSTTVGTMSGLQTVTVVNNNGVTVTGISFSISGANPSDFGIDGSSTCGASLAAGASCTISIFNQPTAPGTRSAQLTIGWTGTSSPKIVTLSGSGI